MQEEVTGKSVALIIDSAKMTEQVFEITSLYLLGNTYRNQNEQDFRVISVPGGFDRNLLRSHKLGYRTRNSVYRSEKNQK